MARILISGKVQGVFFRYEASEKAKELGLFGWVRNTKDGSVEALAQGEEKALTAFIEWCKKGPNRADVKNVEIEWQTPTDEFRDFSIQN